MKKLGVVLCTLIVTLCSVHPVKAEVELYVDPHHLAIQVTETATLRCYHYPEDLDKTTLDWFMPNYHIPISELKENQTFINETNFAISRYSSENGTLTITDAVESDAGTYICKDTNRSLEVEAILKVFIMPSYFTEAMVVLAINLVLIVVFITCYVWRACRDMKERKLQQEDRRKAKLGHKAMAKKLMA